jgi:hypothetical protein
MREPKVRLATLVIYRTAHGKPVAYAHRKGSSGRHCDVRDDHSRGLPDADPVELSVEPDPTGSLQLPFHCTRRGQIEAQKWIADFSQGSTWALRLQH